VVKYIKISEIPNGSKFKAPKGHTPRTTEEVNEADKWWDSLTSNQKCLIFWDLEDDMKF